MLIKYAPIIFSVGILISGCQTPVSPNATALSLDASIVGASQTSRTSARDAFGKTEVISAEGTRGWLSVAYISTNTMGVVAENTEAPRLFLKGWKALKGKTLIYGKTSGVESIPYERFSFPNHTCFHFHKLTTPSPADDTGRYRQLLTGYVCNSDGGEIPGKTISTFLSAITIPRLADSVYEKDVLPITLLEPVRPIRTRVFIEPRDPND